MKAWNGTARATGINQNQARRRAPVQTNESVPITAKIAATTAKMGPRFGTIRTNPVAGTYTMITYARKYARPATITQQPAPTTVMAKVRGTCGCSFGAVAFACWLISVASTASTPMRGHHSDRIPRGTGNRRGHPSIGRTEIRGRIRSWHRGMPGGSASPPSASQRAGSRLTGPVVPEHDEPSAPDADVEAASVEELGCCEPCQLVTARAPAGAAFVTNVSSAVTNPRRREAGGLPQQPPAEIEHLYWRARQDSNLRPSAPEADALSTELQARSPMIPARSGAMASGCSGLVRSPRG